MKRFLIGLMVAAVAAIGFGGVGAFAGVNGGLQAFGTGTVTITGGDSATIDNAANSSGPFPFQYGGVYVQSKDQSGKPLNEVSFSFTSMADVTGGSPRFSIPINTGGGGGSTTAYAFIDAANCGGSTNVSTLVSTTAGKCKGFFQSGTTPHDNRTAVALGPQNNKNPQGQLPFIIPGGGAGRSPRA